MSRIGKYNMTRSLGVGEFGKLKFAVNEETNEEVAIRIFEKDKLSVKNMLTHIAIDVDAIKNLNHPNVIRVKDVLMMSDKYVVVMEFVGGGELLDKVVNEGKLTEDVARGYFKQFVKGLDHYHNHGVYHRDLRPEYLLLDSNGNVKISDFGFSCLYVGDTSETCNRAEMLSSSSYGSPNYVAPEVLDMGSYDGRKADMWSLGVILYVLLAGYLPFDENAMGELFQKIKSADFEYPDWFSQEVRDLISRLVVPDPLKRATMNDVKHHPWLE